MLTLALLILTSPFPAQAVYQCDGETDDCTCGGNNPYPCCDNGGGNEGNCTWWAWESACCNWAVVLPGWGNAKTWAGYANDHPDYQVLASPTEQSISCRLQGYYGHVAWVTAVDGANITVTEMNCCDGCNNGVRTRDYAAAYFDGGYIVRSGGVFCGNGDCDGDEDCGSCPSDCGACPCDVTVEGDVTVIDDTSTCFERRGSPAYWWEVNGYDGHAWFTYGTEGPVDNHGYWWLEVADAGEYSLAVYVPAESPRTGRARYQIRHDGRVDTVDIDQADHQDTWVDLGRFHLAAGDDQHVLLEDVTGEAVGDHYKVLFDALRLSKAVPVEPELPAEPEPPYEAEADASSAEPDAAAESDSAADADTSTDADPPVDADPAADAELAIDGEPEAAADPADPPTTCSDRGGYCTGAQEPCRLGHGPADQRLGCPGRCCLPVASESAREPDALAEATTEPDTGGEGDAGRPAEVDGDAAAGGGDVSGSCGCGAGPASGVGWIGVLALALLAAYRRSLRSLT